ncbi:MAG TPA: SGNH/GDSL hydrolase family protein [Actinomycetes bacterium]|jgi:lysophospholipase L1-like esterase|nr:SGNH/GDSL hydrolase family protein [Actinomycetes bacterium]
MSIQFRYVGRAALLAGGAMVTTLAAEVWAAMHHKFIPSSPVLEISGMVGPEEAEPLTVAVLGDSSVAGVGADAAEDTLAYGVAKALTDRYRVDLHSLGVSGSRLRNVVGEQLPRLAGLDPDVVLICVGTNDLTHSTPTREIRTQLHLLAAGLHTVAPHAVVVVSGLPPASVALCFHWPLRNLLGLRAWALTRVYKSVLGPHGIQVFEVAQHTRDAFRGKREMFSADLFHPSSAGYAFLGTIYGRAVREALDSARGAPPADTDLDLAGDLAG